VQTPPQRVARRTAAARLNRRPPSLVVTLTALAIVCALAWMFFVRTGESSPAPVLSGLQGTYSTSWPADGVAVTVTGRFGAVASGDAGGSEHLPEGEAPGSLVLPESAYDASARTETTYGGVGPTVKLERITGDWPPVWRVATRSPLDYQGLAAVVRTAVEDGDDTIGIKPLEQGERVVWRAAMTMSGKEITLVVDQETGIVTWYSDGDTTFTATVDWASPPPAGTTYSVDVPAGTPEKTVARDAYVYAGSPAAAGKAAGYAPLVSDLAPDGFKLKAVATQAAGYLPADWLGLGDELSHAPVTPPGRAVLQLYTRGLSWFTLEQIGPETVRRLPELADWAAGAAERLSYQETTLQFGAFKGETALTWYQESGPSLFVFGGRRAVFVTGALTRQELIAFAEGLKPVPPPE
jgi:hypothetical protein